MCLVRMVSLSFHYEYFVFTFKLCQDMQLLSINFAANSNTKTFLAAQARLRRYNHLKSKWWKTNVDKENLIEGSTHKGSFWYLIIDAMVEIL